VSIDNAKGTVVKDGPLMLMYFSNTTNGHINIDMDKKKLLEGPLGSLSM